MATHSTGHLDESALMARPTEELGRLGTRSLVFGAVGLVVTAIGFFTARDYFLQSYLIGFMFWMSITLGSLGLTMLHHLTGGAWGMVSRRIWEASAKTLPLMALLFLPIAFNLQTLYSWARPEAASDHLLHLKHAYLNAPFFLGRAALFFVIWGTLVFTLTRWSREQDEQPAELIGPEPKID